MPKYLSLRRVSYVADTTCKANMEFLSCSATMNNDHYYMTWNFSVKIELYNHSNFHANYPRH